MSLILMFASTQGCTKGTMKGSDSDMIPMMLYSVWMCMAYAQYIYSIVYQYILFIFSIYSTYSSWIQSKSTENPFQEMYHESSIHSMVSMVFPPEAWLRTFRQTSLRRLRKLEAEYEQEKESHEMGEVLQKKVPWV